MHFLSGNSEKAVLKNSYETKDLNICSNSINQKGSHLKSKFQST